MHAPEVPRDKLVAFAAAVHGEAVLLKSQDPWANLSRGGDWDLAVPSWRDAEARLTAAAGAPTRAEYRRWQCALFFPWGEVDLLEGLRWRGMPVLTADQLRSGARPGRPFKVARPAHEAIAAWVAPLMAAGSWKQELHKAAVDRAWREDAAQLRQELHRLFGSAVAEDLESDYLHAELTRARDLRVAFALRSFLRAPARSVRAFGGFAAAETLARLAPGLPLIAVEETEVRQLVTSAEACQARIVGLAWCEKGRVRAVSLAEAATEGTVRAEAIDEASLIVLMRLARLRSRGHVGLARRRKNWIGSKLLPRSWRPASLRGLDGDTASTLRRQAP